MGAGFGMLIGRLLQFGQEHAPPGRLGVTTTAIRLLQTPGGALGVSLFGPLLSRLTEGRTAGGTTGSGADGDGVAHGTEAGLGLIQGTDVILFSLAGLLVLATALAVRLPAAPSAVGAPVAAAVTARRTPPAR
ncbi:hypothetical protein [Streptomyces sp. NPDC007088]|uniref:hypothetical protein n=1 Tax=Streptomyces sp. NPDC007088 TaxID=3364773 RepID=UPI0036C2F200